MKHTPKSWLDRTQLQSLAWLVLAWLCTGAAFASHYRGASASYTINSSGLVTVDCYSAWRSDLISPPAFTMRTGAQGAGAAVGSGSMTLTSTTNPFSSGTELGGAQFIVRRDIFTFNLASQPTGTYYARWNSCCRVGGVNNVGEDSWDIELKIIYTAGQASAGPTMLPATIDIVGRTYDYNQNLNSADPDGTPVSYALRTRPSDPFAPTTQIPGLSVSSIGTVSVPAANTTSLTLGRWAYKVEVTDGSGATAQRDVLVLVQDALGNVPPVLSAIGNRTVNVNTPLTFNVSGTDTAGQNLTVRAQRLPNGATFPQASANTSVSSTFSWTPVNGQEGTYFVNFEVYDNASTILIDSELVEITVTGGNNPPVLDPVGNRTIANGGTLTFSVSGSDPDPGQSVTFEAFNLPPGATFVSPTFSWTPSAGQFNNTFTGITFRARDNGAPNLTDDEAIVITVGAGNQAPVVTAVGPQTVAAGNTLTFNVSANDANTGQTISLAPGTGGLPPGATFPTVNGPNTGVMSTFTWTPTLAQGGNYNVRFRAQDNGTPILTDEVIVPISVITDAVTQVPILTTPANNTITTSPVSVDFTLPEAASPMTVRLLFDDGSTVRTLILDGTKESAAQHVFTFDPANPSAGPFVGVIPVIPDGVYTVTLSYQDAFGNAAATDSSTNVRIDTIAPLLNLPANMTVEATSPAGAVVNYVANASDLGGSGVASFIANPASGSVFSIGITSVNATATDHAGNTAMGSFNVTVQDTTDPLIVTLPAAPTYPAGATCDALLPDLTGGVVASDAVGVVNVTQNPVPGTALGIGVHPVVFTVTDTAGNFAQGSINVTVVDVTGPTFTALPASFGLIALTPTVPLPNLLPQVAATDTCSPPVSITQDPVAGTPLAPGAHLVTFTATDDAGNFTTAQITVTVTAISAVAGNYADYVRLGGNTRGLLVVTVTPAGNLTAKLTLEGARYGLKGTVDSNGATTVSRDRSAGLTPLTISFVVVQGSPLSYDVTITDGTTSWTSQPEKSPFSNLNPAPYAANYTAVFPVGAADAGDPAKPQGYGIATMKVKKTGAYRAVGKMGDGASWSTASVVMGDGSSPFYARVYSLPYGSAYGDLTFTAGQPLPTPDVAGTLSWVKPSGVKPDTVYPAGFTATPTVLGSRYVKPLNLTGVLTLNPARTAIFGFTEGALPAPLTSNATILPTNPQIVAPPLTLLKLALGNGRISGRMTHPTDNRSRVIYGAVLQKQNIGYGFFYGPQVTGALSLTPNP